MYYNSRIVFKKGRKIKRIDPFFLKQNLSLMTIISFNGMKLQQNIAKGIYEKKKHENIFSFFCLFPKKSLVNLRYPFNDHITIFFRNRIRSKFFKNNKTHNKIRKILWSKFEVIETFYRIGSKKHPFSYVVITQVGNVFSMLVNPQR